MKPEDLNVCVCDLERHKRSETELGSEIDERDENLAGCESYGPN